MIRGLLCLLLLSSGAAVAEQKQDFGEYAVHYSAQNSMALSPEVARQHGLRRNPQLAMVMLTVQDRSGAAVAATVTGQARNLLGQSQVLEMRETRDRDSIYYLGLLTISNRDTQAFTFDIRPGSQPQPLVLRFSQQFFVD